MASDTSTTESVLERARNPKQQLTRENLESAAKTGLLAVSALVALVPLYWMVTTSLKTSQEASQFPPTLFPDNPTIQPYIEGWNAGMWPTWFFNTTVISAGTVTAILLVVTPAAYAVARHEFIGKRAFYLTVVATLMIPGQIIVLPLYALFADFGLIDTHIGLILAYTVFWSGFAFFLLYGFFQNLPADIEDAARVAGIPEWKIMIRLILPLAKPGVATAGMFLFIFAWNEFFLALVFLESQSMFTFSIGLEFFRGLRGYVVVNQMFAISTLASLPVLLLFALFQKQFVQGITTGFAE